MPVSMRYSSAILHRERGPVSVPKAIYIIDFDLATVVLLFEVTLRTSCATAEEPSVAHCTPGFL